MNIENHLSMETECDSWCRKKLLKMDTQILSVPKKLWHVRLWLPSIPSSCATPQPTARHSFGCHFKHIAYVHEFMMTSKMDRRICCCLRLVKCWQCLYDTQTSSFSIFNCAMMYCGKKTWKINMIRTLKAMRSSVRFAFTCFWLPQWIFQLPRTNFLLNPCISMAIERRAIDFTSRLAYQLLEEFNA